MTYDEFKSEFAELLGIAPTALQEDTRLHDLDAWDSVTVLSVIVLIDERLGVALRPDVFARAATFADILAPIRDKFDA